MAGGKYSRKQRLKRDEESSYSRCVVAVFQVVVFCHNVSNIAAQDYLHSSIPAEVAMPDITMFSRKEAQMVSDLEQISLSDRKIVAMQAEVIRFEPPYLDFGAQSIGIPVIKRVFVYNPSKTKHLHLNSISALTSHFHSSFFEEKAVPPGANTTFEVVFLARLMGNVENTLFIDTAAGTFTYQVFGVGLPNPYRLRSYLGAKVSLNSSFSPLISMYNPTGSPLQVTEIYSSSGFLHLQLPTGRQEASKQDWEIPPYESRPLMQASFLGQVADNHTAFIRIKTSRGVNDDDLTPQYLILPMEVEVSPSPGIYSSLEMLDFGTLRTHDPPRVLSVFLLNSGSRDVQISSLETKPPNPAVSIDFRPFKLKPSEALFTRVANVSFNAMLSESAADWMGKIVVGTKEKAYNNLAIPFQANVLDGTLGFNESATALHIPQDDDQVASNISLTNSFNFPVILHKIELPDVASTFFQIVNFTSPIVLPPQQTVYCFTLGCAPGHVRDELKRNGVVSLPHHLILHTNTSAFSLPLHAYTGALEYEVQHGNSRDLDFGIMATEDQRRLLVVVRNNNPVSVPILNYNSTVPGVRIEILSVTQNGESLPHVIHSSQITVPRNACVVFDVILTAPAREAALNGCLAIHAKYQTLEIALKARVAIGSLTLKPDHFKFAPSFPGMTVHQILTVTNSFSQATKIESLTSPDKRFYQRKLRNVGCELEAGREVKIGKVYFDARQDCKADRCYVGLPTSTTVGHHWLTTLNLGKDAPEVDRKLYRAHRERWRSLQANNRTRPSTVFELSTNTMHTFRIPAVGHLYWPTLTDQSAFTFPLTLVGKTSEIEMVLFNPSDFPIVLQVMPISFYPAPATALDALDVGHLLTRAGFVRDDLQLFQIRAQANTSAQDQASQLMWLQYTLGEKLTNGSCANMFLNPGQRQTVRVIFSPERDVLASTIILIRNNLTVLESVFVEGRAVREQLKLGGKLSNNVTDSLRIKLTESLLRDCRGKKEAPYFTVRKSFMAKNLGELPLHVHYMLIDNYPCEGYGFRVLDCEPFLMQPNATREIIIAFTPDFTCSRVTRTLRVVTSQGSVLTFALNVSLPHHMLAECQRAVPRPAWEPTLHFAIVSTMTITLIGVVFVAFREAQYMWENFIQPYEANLARCKLRELEQHHKSSGGVVVSQSFRTPSPDPDKFKAFSLRNVASDFRSRICAVSEPGRSSSINLQRRATTSISELVASCKHTISNLLRFDFSRAIKRYRNTLTRRRHYHRHHSPTRRALTPPPAPRTPPPVAGADSSSHILPYEIASSGSASAPSDAVKVRQRPVSNCRKSKAAAKKTNALSGATKAPSPKSSPALALMGAVVPTTAPSLDEIDRISPVVSTAATSGGDATKKSSSSSSGDCESSHSRRSSLSSVSDKLPPFTAVSEVSKQKRRKNKLHRQASFAIENDDSSSTTTDRSIEDDEISVKTTLKEVWKNERRPKSESKAPVKRNSNMQELRPTSSSIFPVANEVASENRRGVRQNDTRSSNPAANSSNKPVSSTHSKVNQVSRNPTFYDTTSSTDEQHSAWEVPKKVKSNSQDADDRMRMLSEQTMKLDGKMRTKTSPKQKHESSPQLLATSNCRINSYSSVVSSSHANEISNKSAASAAAAATNKGMISEVVTTTSKSTPPSSRRPATPSPPPPTTTVSTSEKLPSPSSSSEFSIFSSPDSKQSSNCTPVNTRLPAWSHFGHNSFNIADGLIRRSPRVRSADLGLSSDATPSPTRWDAFDSMPHRTIPMPPAASTSLAGGWGRGPNNLYGIAATTMTTTPSTAAGAASAAPTDWGNGGEATPPSSTTHTIWSVSNAVTMDENKEAVASDPLGLRSIWNTTDASSRLRTYHLP